VLNADRPEFEKQLAILCAAMDVPCTEERKEGYWKALHSMPLIRFVRTIQHMLENESWVKIPKPSQIWDASKRLKSDQHFGAKDDGFRGDMWDIAANVNLRDHLTFRLKNKMALPGTLASYEAMRASDEELRIRGLDKHNLDASPEFLAAVGKLICAKNNWAADMRDLSSNDPVPLETQRAVWVGYLREAEA
jgi:hypothetical protein